MLWTTISDIDTKLITFHNQDDIQGYSLFRMFL